MLYRIIHVFALYRTLKCFLSPELNLHKPFNFLKAFYIYLQIRNKFNTFGSNYSFKKLIFLKTLIFDFKKKMINFNIAITCVVLVFKFFGCLNNLISSNKLQLNTFEI